MRNSRVLTGTALSIAALGLASAPALAGDFGKLEVSPNPVKPGAEVTVNTTACGANGSGTGDASAVGGPASFQLKPGTHKESVNGTFKVPNSAKAGTYGIGVKCHNGKEATGDVVVSAGSGGSASSGSGTGGTSMGGASHSPSMGTGGGSSTPAKPPKGGMKTGVGGSSDDSGMTELMAGAAVLATAAVGGTWYLRRRGSNANRI
ncbi:hypothetical protein B7P34_34305 [Streptosporangium nondiastaticum]|uniref:Sortase n=2 Tax=Actinomycetes TaxID=1760 RepID=A0A9X7JIX0_9ACTN|nr:MULTISPECIES: hypothetical protein [Actinomycetes]PSJ24269.1 hypothetical protein B7P34_34305 [Streptosporangium nondiastaticum]WKU45318.1 hypothetical protein Q3V23_15275 [Streptomyces sp. VNUA116]